MQVMQSTACPERSDMIDLPPNISESSDAADPDAPKSIRRSGKTDNTDEAANPRAVASPDEKVSQLKLKCKLFYLMREASTSNGGSRNADSMHVRLTTTPKVSHEITQELFTLDAAKCIERSPEETQNYWQTS